MGEGAAGILYSASAALYLLNAGLHSLYRILGILLDAHNHGGNLTGRGLGLLCQLSYFLGHNGKSPAVLTSAGSLNSRIQCQQVGLLGNRGNGVNDNADLLALLAKALNNLCNMGNSSINSFHVVHRSTYIGTSLLCHLVSLLNLVAAFTNRSGEFLHVGGQVADVAGSGFHLSKLLTAGACHIHHGLSNGLADSSCLLGCGGQLLGGRCQILGSLHNLLHQLQELALHIIHSMSHDTQLIRSGCQCPHLCSILLMSAEIAISHPLDMLGNQLNRRSNTVANINGKSYKQHQQNDDNNYSGQDAALQLTLQKCLLLGNLGINLVNPDTGTHYPAPWLEADSIVALR